MTSLDPIAPGAESDAAAADLQDAFAASAEVLASAPGRVNLMGGHTDYNEGFVLPMALEFRTAIALAPRTDSRVRLVSRGFESVEFDLADDPASVPGWARYVAGMADFLETRSGFDAALTSTIPHGAGLSSSAALEVAAGFALTAMAGGQPDPHHIARLGQRVENEVIGLNTGIMDQLISATAVEGHASLIDCRDFSSSAVPIPPSAVVAVLDTMTRRELENSAYGERRADCERVAAAIGVSALRDATLDDLDRPAVIALGADVVRRARHIITENDRTTRSAAELVNGDVASFGSRMSETHRSLRDDFEVSSAALDRMVEIAQEQPGCHGARMTGGGFGGSAVAIVDVDCVAEFEAEVQRTYRSPDGRPPQTWVFVPSPGATAIVV